MVGRNRGADDERRRDRRYAFERAVRYRFFHPGISPSGFWEAVSRDVSHHGIRLWTEREIPCGARVEIFILDAHGEPKVRGVVEAVRCTRRTLTDERYNEYYNPETMVEYEVGCRSTGSVLFDRVGDIR